eukprot:COSAG02_NODE_5196_length_4549_cov_2.138427_3_plen_134_part_00
MHDVDRQAIAIQKNTVVVIDLYITACTRAALPYNSVEELIQLAGRMPDGPIEVLGIAAHAEMEKNHLQWCAQDKALRPEEATESEDEEDEDAEKPDEKKQSACGGRNRLNITRLPEDAEHRDRLRVEAPMHLA